MNEKILGIRLKQLREKTGLSQAKFAKVLGGVSQPVIARYETGDFFPSYPVLIKIADYFNVSTDYLLGVDMTSTVNVAGLSEKDIQIVNALISHLREKE